ncbi:MAG TPA: acyloxyacyl hydrolase [Alphaproteobacteria bacterium]|nr:acyloxyacyl hydrolase [Alphaproteobacteria bacterium]
MARRWRGSVAALLAAAAVVLAGSYPARAADGIIDQLKFGVLEHDATIGGHHKEPGADINAEVQFSSPAFLSIIWAPRPTLGTDINTDGKTSQFYGGLTWTILNFKDVFTADDAIFLDGSLGGAIHDGHLSGGGSDDKQLGSRVLFRESIDLGYQFVKRQSVSVFVDHISDAGLTSQNQGITNLGVRYGYGF